jgi:hypothetical protein
MMFEQGCSGVIAINKIEQWNKVQGIITQSEVEQTVGPNGATSYSPVIQYNYSVDGLNYSNNIIQMGMEEDIRTRWEAESKIATYGINSDVTVLVNPSNPNQSTLNGGDKSLEKPLMYYASFFFLLAYLINRKSINHIIKKLLLKDYKRKEEGWLVP